MEDVQEPEKHPIYGWETKSEYYYKMIKQDRGEYENEGYLQTYGGWR
jgi:hypothetical protein